MTSIAIIGMPGVGKSTVGVLLAKKLALRFVDTDLIIQLQERKTLQEIIDHSGYQALRQIEEQVILQESFSGAVIATGGSVVYSEKGMTKLKELGSVVYLSCNPAQLLQRITNYSERGIAAHPEQGFADMFAERERLYKRYANVVIETDTFTPARVVDEVVSWLTTLD